MPEQSNRSRRDFLTKGLQTAAFASIATAIPSVASAGQSPGCIDPTQLPWDEEMDILVIGSGIAGSVAAIKAAETRAGMKIVIADKMSRLGGSSLISGLNMAVVGSEWQKAMGVTDDSWELLYADMERESRGFNHPDISKVVAQNSLTLFNFMAEHGVEYDKSMGNGTGVKDLGGHSRARVVWPKEGGTGVIKNLHAYMARHLPNIEIRKRVKLEEIYRDGGGRVVGVRVREEYFFDLDTPDFGRNDDPAFNGTGVTRFYKVKRALVMASGGFNQDRKFRGDEIGVLHDCVSTASPGATGGALKCMMQAGFKPVHMTLFRFAFAIPTEDINWGILVNPQTCRRFINEHNNNDRQGLGLAILAERRKLKPGQQAILIYDQTGVDSYHDKQRLHLSLEAKNGTEGTIWKFDTLAALLAALVIIPGMAVGGAELSSGGPGLMFIYLVNVFNGMPGGKIVGIIFYICVLFAGMSSLVNLYEAPVATLQERFGLKRVSAVGIIAAFGCCIALLIQGIVSGWMDAVSIYICPLGAMLAAIMFFWIADKEFALKAVNTGREKKIGTWFLPLGKYVLVPLALVALIAGAVLGGIG